MLPFDAFAAHLIDGVKAQLLESNSDILLIPAACTLYFLVQDQEMDNHSFQVCSITSLDPDKVHNSAFFKQCMGKTLHNLETNDANEIDDDPFKLYD